MVDGGRCSLALGHRATEFKGTMAGFWTSAHGRGRVDDPTKVLVPSDSATALCQTGDPVDGVVFAGLGHHRNGDSDSWSGGRHPLFGLCVFLRLDFGLGLAQRVERSPRGALVHGCHGHRGSLFLGNHRNVTFHQNDA